MRGRRWGVALAMLLSACTNEGTLVVQVRTDLTPQVGFERARVELMRPGATDDPRLVDADAHRAWGTGVRVAEIAGLAPGSYRVNVALLDGSGDVIVQRAARVEIDGGVHVATILLTRDCAGVECPLAGDAVEATQCLAGACVPEDCTEETPEACGLPACTPDDCPAPAGGCGRAECTATGACFAVLDHDACRDGEVCDAERGCLPASAGCPDLDGDGTCDAVDPDVDGDGVPGAVDCDDLDPTVYPGAPELCDGIDNDCDQGGGPIVLPGAIFVSSSPLPAWATPSTTTVAEAVDLAIAMGGGEIIVASGTFVEPLPIIIAGARVTIRGGRNGDCEFAPDGSHSVIQGPGPVFNLSAAAEVLLEDLDVEGLADVGEPVIGLRVSGSIVEALRCEITTADATMGTTAIAMDMGTLTLEDTVLVPGAAGPGVSSGLDAGEGSVTVRRGRVVVGGSAAAIGVYVGEGSLTMDRSFVSVTGTGLGAGVRVEGARTQITNSLIAARGPTLGGVGLEAQAEALVQHSSVYGASTDGPARAALSMSPGFTLVNSILRAETTMTGSGDAAAVEIDGMSTIRLLGCDVTAAGMLASGVTSMESGSIDVAAFEASCGSLDVCAEARGNVFFGCALDPDGNLLGTDCVDQGVEAQATTPSDLLDVDYQGDPRPTGAGPDIGPDEM